MKKNQTWIVSNQGVLGGKPVIRGTRIAVTFILELLASGMTVDDILQEFPHLKREGVLAAIDYAAKSLEGERVLPLEVKV